MKRDIVFMGGFMGMMVLGTILRFYIPPTWPYAVWIGTGIQLAFMFPFIALFKFMDFLEETERNQFRWLAVMNQALKTIGIMYLATSQPDDRRSSSRMIGYGEFSFVDREGKLRTVKVPRFFTKFDVPKKYQIENYPRFDKIERFALIHLLPPEVRFDFGKGKTVWDELETKTENVCNIFVDEGYYKYRDEKEKVEYPVFEVLISSADKQFREHPERLYELSVEKKPIEDWTKEEIQNFNAEVKQKLGGSEE